MQTAFLEQWSLDTLGPARKRLELALVGIFRLEFVCHHGKVGWSPRAEGIFYITLF